jgi:DNA polymerase-3 subunit beta
MKLSISKAELLKGLSRIQSIVEKRNTMPILANVLLNAKPDDGGRLELAATDLEVGIRSLHAATVKKPGQVTVSARKIFEIVRELPDEMVLIEASVNAYLQINCARAQFTLSGSAAEEYPTLPAFTSDKTVPVQALLLQQMIEQTMYAASIDETRYNLNGVYFEYLTDSGKTRMVATDGHRLAIVDRALGGNLEGLDAGVIIPRKGLAELKRLLDEEDTDEFEMGFDGNNSLVRKGDVTLVMRLIEGEFPNYRQVIPKEANIHLTLPVEGLSRALRRVALLSAERSRAIKLELTTGQLCLSSNNPDVGDAREELDVDYAGDPLSIAFNARYLMDALTAVKAKEVRIDLRDESSPTQLRPTDDDDALAVVMPMRV